MHTEPDVDALLLPRIALVASNGDQWSEIAVAPTDVNLETTHVEAIHVVVKLDAHDTLPSEIWQQYPVNTPNSIFASKRLVSLAQMHVLLSGPLFHQANFCPDRTTDAVVIRGKQINTSLH